MERALENLYLLRVMRKVIFESSVSVDGFIEGPDGAVDWWKFDKEVFSSAGFISRFDTVFFGRRAYERFGVPRQTGQLPAAQREFHEAVSHMRKYVFSRVYKHVAGNGMVVSENLEDEVKRISEEEGKSIWLCGGADILKTFAGLDLIDEYMLTVHPVLLRAGKPLFEGAKPLNLQLVSKHVLRSGVVKLRYRPRRRLNNP